MRDPSRCVLANKRIDLPPGVLQPREAVLRMAPYSPPTGGRAGKLRLDFNENTVGASPKVIEYLREHLSEAGLAIYPEYTRDQAGTRGLLRRRAGRFHPHQRNRRGHPGADQHLHRRWRRGLAAAAVLRHVPLLCRSGRRQHPRDFVSRAKARLPAGRAVGRDSSGYARHADRESEQSHWDRNIARGHRAHSRKGHQRRGLDR